MKNLYRYYQNLTTPNQLIIINISIFLILNILSLFFNENEYNSYILPYFAYSSTDFKFSSIILHGFSHLSILHLLSNMIALYFIGELLVKRLTSKEIWYLYLGSCLVGSLALYVLSTLTNVDFTALGASGAVFTLFAIVNKFYGREEYLFFFFRMELNTIFLINVGISVLMILLNSNLGGGVVHLVCAYSGWLYYRIKFQPF